MKRQLTIPELEGISSEDRVMTKHGRVGRVICAEPGLCSVKFDDGEIKLFDPKLLMKLPPVEIKVGDLVTVVKGKKCYEEQGVVERVEKNTVYLRHGQSLPCSHPKKNLRAEKEFNPDE